MGERRPVSEAEAKALASAVRLRILRLCLDEAHTNKEIAERLDLNPATALHHVRTLVSTGFLAPQEVRRGPRGSREVPYLTAGDAVPFAPVALRLTDEQYAELRMRLITLLDEFAGLPRHPDGKAYSLFVALFDDVSRD